MSMPQHFLHMFFHQNTEYSVLGSGLGSRSGVRGAPKLQVSKN